MMANSSEKNKIHKWTENIDEYCRNVSVRIFKTKVVWPRKKKLKVACVKFRLEANLFNLWFTQRQVSTTKTRTSSFANIDNLCRNVLYLQKGSLWVLLVGIFSS